MSLLPAAAPEPLRALLTGPTRGARVLGVSPAAAYLAVPGGGVLALLAQDAVRLPFGMVVVEPADDLPWRDLQPDATALVGEGRVAVGEVLVSAARWWRPRHPRPPASPESFLAGSAVLAAALPPCPDAPPLPYPPLYDEALYDEALLGLGPGLTPYGDDVLAGQLLVAASFRRSRPASSASARRIAALLTSACSRTTILSAACLRHAARGEAAIEAVSLLDALGGHGDVADALDALLRVGHTSGHGLAYGILSGLQQMADLDGAARVPAAAARTSTSTPTASREDSE